jgi:hypothetical protein
LVRWVVWGIAAAHPKPNFERLTINSLMAAQQFGAHQQSKEALRLLQRQ